MSSLSAVKKFLIPIILLLLCGCITLLLCSCVVQEADSGSILSSEFQTVKTANYKTATAATGDLIKTSTLSLEPRYTVSDSLKYIGGNEVYFERFYVANNQEVAKGDILASFTKKGSQAETEKHRLAYERAAEQYRAACEQLLEAAQAPGLSAIEAQLLMLDYEQYVLNEGAALSDLEEQMDAAQDVLEPEYLYAPYDGVVSSFAAVNEGTLIAADKELMIIKKSDTLLVVGQTSTSNFLYNMNVTVEYGKNDERKTVTGRVVSTDRVMPEGSPPTDEIIVKLDEQIPASELTKAQMSVTTVQAKNALLVPRAALTIESGRYYVSILSGDMVQKRYVLRGIVGGTVGEQSAVILSGLEAGQTVILD